MALTESQHKLGIYEFSDFRLDSYRGVLFFKNLPVRLAPKPFELLLLLLKHEGSIVPVDTIFENVWPDILVQWGNVAACIHVIRKALRLYERSANYIHTSHGGYMFDGKVNVIQEFGSEDRPHFENGRPPKHKAQWMTFEFPVALKVSCEQYLLYFGQFLQDLGIDATSNIREDAGKVLFSVLPNDNLEALEKIQEALAIYLDLPSGPILFDDSFAAIRLQQQIDNLHHSQKMAAREVQFTEKLLIAHSETIQEKNITISQKDSTIDQQRRIIEKIMSNSIMMDSVDNKEEFEKIIDGLKVGESKWLKDKLGIKVNPVKSLKSLGDKLLRKDEEIVTLDLVEQEAENDANN